MRIFYEYGTALHVGLSLSISEHTCVIVHCYECMVTCDCDLLYVVTNGMMMSMGG